MLLLVLVIDSLILSILVACKDSCKRGSGSLSTLRAPRGCSKGGSGKSLGSEKAPAKPASPSGWPDFGGLSCPFSEPPPAVHPALCSVDSFSPWEQLLEVSP